MSLLFVFVRAFRRLFLFFLMCYFILKGERQSYHEILFQSNNNHWCLCNINNVRDIILLLKLFFKFMTEVLQVYIVSIFQIIIAVGLVNVWLIRFNKATKYRGGNAGNMTDEFAVYGLPKWFMYIVGASKILIASAMILGFFVPSVVFPASLVLCLLMLGAISMHIKVKDPFVKALPATLMFLIALINVILINFI